MVNKWEIWELYHSPGWWKAEKCHPPWKIEHYPMGQCQRNQKYKMFFIICAIQWIAISQLIAFFTSQKTWACSIGNNLWIKVDWDYSIKLLFAHQHIVTFVLNVCCDINTVSIFGLLTTLITSDVNDFVNAKSHAREK